MTLIIVFSLAIYCSFYIFLFSRLAIYKPIPRNENDIEKKISIVVCYHNEGNKVDTYLPSILNQMNDEVVLVDDNSSDNTLELLKTYKSDQVKIISNKRDSVGKKLAVSMGIQAAKNDDILLTDADCMPASQKWLYHMSNSSSSFVLGYGPMMRGYGIVGLFSRFETYTTALQYLSYALLGMPYMGVGRNLRIDKRVLSRFSNKIKGHKLASGDDDLMINALSNKNNTSICIHPESFVYSLPKTTLKAFLNQKKRHIGTSVYYKTHHKVLLGLFSATQILFYVGLILAAGTISFKLALQLLLIKWTIQQMINYPIMKKLKEEDLFWMFPLLDILFFFYLLVMPFYSLLNKNNSRWN